MATANPPRASTYPSKHTILAIYSARAGANFKHMTKKTLTLDFVGYRITGVADVTPWGGGNACIQMDPFFTDDISKKFLRANLNDGKFGVESINGGICHISEVYADDQGNKIYKYIKTTTVGTVQPLTRQYEEEIPVWPS